MYNININMKYMVHNKRRSIGSQIRLDLLQLDIFKNFNRNKSQNNWVILWVYIFPYIFK